MTIPPTRLRGLVLVTVSALILWLAPAPTPQAIPQDRHITVEASQFQFTPAVIAVNPGDRVTLEVKAMDVVHGVYIDTYGLNVTADPGQTARLTFVADKAGTFQMRCSIACGAMHPFMVGKLKVGPDWLLWRALGVAGLAALSSLWLLRK